ncbi:hypothetical protein J3R83DRAFT_11917 [Lanmaoa asiatica]|nr:hypothetical protein J3R83DRAFT_11917 [Lanmaoa asiatica]
MTVQVPAPRDVQTTFNYYQPTDDQAPYFYVEEPPAGVLRSNIGMDPRPAVVRDARGKEETLGLDVSGFQFVTYPSVEKEFVDEEKIRTVYYTEVEELLKKHTDRAFQGAVRTPVHNVHVDQTSEAAEQRVRLHMGDEAERLLKGRYRIINVWRPIANPVAHNPLGVADFRTVDVDVDLVPTRLIYPDREGGTYGVKYDPGHKWYYLSDQTPDEATLIKCFDSDTGKARLTPHSAFSDKTSPADAPQRQSIEVRALVFDRE